MSDIVCSECRFWFKKENILDLDLGGYCRPYKRAAANKKAESWCEADAPACINFTPRKRKKINRTF